MASRSEISDPAQDGNHIELSIVMPCLDEAETLETCITKAQGFLNKHDICGEIVIGDNGSTDGSQAIAERCGARVVQVPVRGYGAALYHATCQAKGQYIIMGDSDDSYDFSDLMPFVTKLREGYDLVVGNRFEGGIQEGAMPWKNRYIGNPILTTIGRLFFGARVRDFHCGLRGFSKQAFVRMELCTTGMEYASEMVIKSVLKDMKIEEVPTTLSRDGRSRSPHLDPWRDGWRHLRFMLLYSPRWLFLYPGIVLIVLGTVLGIWVVPEAKVVGGIRFDIHTLLYGCVAILIGFQAVSFFLLSRVFAAREGLLPYTEGLQRFTAWFRMEWSIAAGSVLAAFGIGGLVGILFHWGSAGFGGLDVSQTMRIAIPSATATAIGCNVVLTSLFLDILNLPTKPGSADQAT